MYDIIIIVPYRDRESHLNQFKQRVVEVFKKHLGKFKIIIVEQNDDKLFNRGNLLNVGINEYKDSTRFFITHDVDMLPNEVIVKDHYTNTEFDVYTIACTHRNSFGQVCKFKHDCLIDVNGFPNHIWGWGIEDRALYYRCNILKKNISSFCDRRKFYKMLPHKSNGEIYKGEKLKISNLETEIYKCNDKKRQLEHIKQSGLNNLEYKLVESVEIDEYITHIKVNL